MQEVHPLYGDLLTLSRRPSISSSDNGSDCSSVSEATNSRSSLVSDGMDSDVLSQHVEVSRHPDPPSLHSDTSQEVLLFWDGSRLGVMLGCFRKAAHLC